MEKLFFIDVETTGTDETKNGLVQLSGAIDIDGEKVEELDLLMKPFPDDIIEDEALEKQGRTREEIMEFPDPREVYAELISIMEQYIDRYDSSDKFTFIAYNSDFDERFVREFFKKNGDKYFGSWWSWPSVCVAKMIAYKYRSERHKFPNFQLMTVAEKLGMEVDEEKAHDALYDIEVTRELFHGMDKLLTKKLMV